MWVGDNNWLHEGSEAVPIILLIMGVIQFFLGRATKFENNQKEVAVLRETDKKNTLSIEALEERVSRLEGDVRHADQRTTEACKDIAVMRDRMDKNTDNISYMLGRMDFGKNQRPGGQNDKR